MNSPTTPSSPSIPHIGSTRSASAGRKGLPSASDRRASIAFGGGAARGIAHLGAMQAIAESGLRIDHVIRPAIGTRA